MGYLALLLGQRLRAQLVYALLEARHYDNRMSAAPDSLRLGSRRVELASRDVQGSVL